MILVTGTARSGTSLTTRILHAHGCHLGQVNALFENMEIREGVLKPYLRSVGADPAGQRTLPDADTLQPAPGLRRGVMAAFRGRARAAYKDAKLCLVWPVWAEAFPEAKWVIVRRDRESIVDSCIRTPFMTAYRDDRDGWSAWVGEYESRIEAMKAAGLDCIEVWPRDYIRDPEVFRPVAEHCGLAFDVEAVRAPIDPALFREHERTA